MRDISFLEGEAYHVFIRGVEKRNIFENDRDRKRFVFLLHYANDASGVPIRMDRGKNSVLTTEKREEREPLVAILAWCLMSNHVHLLLKEIRRGGISVFMHRLQVSHALYFNTKYQRSGPLFSGKFKAVHIEDDVQYTHTGRYIHLNPLELFDPMWKERGYVEDKLGAEKFLKGYKWSSLPDYLGEERDFATIVDKESTMEYFDNKVDDYRKFINDWLEPGSNHLGILRDVMMLYGE